MHLSKANHLISINYTMANETVVSTHPIGDEFFGLSSLLIDPITGAFYDRYTNQLYFFKGKFLSAPKFLPQAKLNLNLNSNEIFTWRESFSSVRLLRHDYQSNLASCVRSLLVRNANYHLRVSRTGKLVE